MSTSNGIPYVLVHGAYHGGWCWDAVTRELQPNNVYTPTLSGLSERCQSNLRPITLETHVRDIVELIELENLDSVHLVGWSYGGMVVTGVLAEVPSRISAVTYLDAHLPRHGQSVASFLGRKERTLLRLASWIGKGIDPPDPRKWGVEDSDLLESLKEKLTPQPPRTLTQPVNAPEPWPSEVNYSYIWCKGYEGSIFGKFFEIAKSDSRFRVVELESSHASPFTNPKEVAHAICT